MANPWKRDTWKPPQAIASVNGVMPHDTSVILPPSALPQPMPEGVFAASLRSSPFPLGDGAPPMSVLPERDNAPVRVERQPTKGRTTPKGRQATGGEQGGVDRVLPGMARGRAGKFDEPKGERFDARSADKERLSGMLDADREMEDYERPQRPQRQQTGKGDGQKKESTRRQYLGKPQLMTKSLVGDAMEGDNEEFIAPGAQLPMMPTESDMMAILPLLMQMSGQGMGMGGMPMNGQGMPPMMPQAPLMPGIGVPGTMPPMGGAGMQGMPMPGMMPEEEMMQPSWGGRSW